MLKVIKNSYVGWPWSFTILALSVALIGFVSCSKPVIDPMPISKNKEMIINASPMPIKFEVEIADTAPKRAYGLMHRKSLPPNHGMLFIFDRLDRQIFWMKNTLLSLDLIFFDENFQIVGVIENTTPMSSEMLDIGQNSRYVLEVVAGTVKKYGINLHSTAKLSYE